MGERRRQRGVEAVAGPGRVHDGDGMPLHRADLPGLIQIGRSVGSQRCHDLGRAQVLQPPHRRAEEIAGRYAGRLRLHPGIPSEFGAVGRQIVDMAIEFLRQFSGRRGVQDDLLAQRFGGASGVKYRLHRDFQLEQHDIGLLQLVQVLIDIRGRHPVVSAGDHNDAVVPLGDID
ncbi:hypothetical protein D3C81_1133880 [compost metagenome]